MKETDLVIFHTCGSDNNSCDAACTRREKSILLSAPCSGSSLEQWEGIKESKQLSLFLLLLHLWWN